MNTVHIRLGVGNMNALAASPTNYHHGNLEFALIEAALDLARSGGPEAVTIRAATRIAGVSPAAAYRHFADRSALLVAAANRATAGLADKMVQTSQELGGTTKNERALNQLRGVGLGYIRFCLAEPGWSALAAAARKHQRFAPTESAASPTPFDLLMAALDQLVEVGLLTARQRENAEWSCWSTVDGFSSLATTGPLADLAAEQLDQLALAAVDTIIAGLRAR